MLTPTTPTFTVDSLMRIRGLLAPTQRPDRIRLVYGLVLLLAPDRLAHAATGVTLDGRARAVARILAVRQISQALLTGRAERPLPPRVGQAVDALHALSMAGLAIANPRRRRLAIASCAAATFFLVTVPRSRSDLAEPPPTTAVADGGPDSPSSSDARSSASPTHDKGPRWRRERAALRQQAIREVLLGAEGQPVARVRADLQAALTARGAAPQPDGWIEAVASDAALGRIYVVSEQAMNDTGGELPREGDAEHG